MSEYTLVTTFNRAGYQLYGQRMIETFIRCWPDDQKLIVYYEDFEADEQIKNCERVILRDVAGLGDLAVFKERHRRNRKAHGFWPAGETIQNFKWDAVKFSHKVFALGDAVANPLPEAAGLVWLDGDTISIQDVPATFLSSVVPLGDTGITYLGRDHTHSECGFMGFNLAHPLMTDFWREFLDLYRQDTLFALEEWHDSFAFDHVRRQFEEKGMINHNLSPVTDYEINHPFINSELGLYMDHMKGRRKQVGRSKRRERKTVTDNDPGWWRG